MSELRIRALEEENKELRSTIKALERLLAHHMKKEGEK